MRAFIVQWRRIQELIHGGLAFCSADPNLTPFEKEMKMVETLGTGRFWPEFNNPLIVALDNMSTSNLLGLAEKLKNTGCGFKIEDALIREGASLIGMLSQFGPVMADLKLHQTPDTIRNTCKWLKPFAPWAVTVHACGTKRMIEAAVDAFEGTPTKVLAITVLTSTHIVDCNEIYRRRPPAQTQHMAEIASKAGSHGLVCSPREASSLKSSYPQLELVCPGIREEGSRKDDQVRTRSPEEAAIAGADFAVVGRPICDSKDPVAAAERIRRKFDFGKCSHG
jgi:orotidine-5'-phosphate decarboxylase